MFASTMSSSIFANKVSLIVVLEILLMAAKIYNGYHFMTFLNEFFSIFIFILVEPFRKYMLYALIETYDFMTNELALSVFC